MTLQCCHSGLDPESSLFNLDSRFRGNGSSRIIVKPLLRRNTSDSELLGGVDGSLLSGIDKWRVEGGPADNVFFKDKEEG